MFRPWPSEPAIFLRLFWSFRFLYKDQKPLSYFLARQSTSRASLSRRTCSRPSVPSAWAVCLLPDMVCLGLFLCCSHPANHIHCVRTPRQPVAVRSTAQETEYYFLWRILLQLFCPQRRSRRTLPVQLCHYIRGVLKAMQRRARTVLRRPSVFLRRHQDLPLRVSAPR